MNCFLFWSEDDYANDVGSGMLTMMHGYRDYNPTDRCIYFSSVDDHVTFPSHDLSITALDTYYDGFCLRTRDDGGIIMVDTSQQNCFLCNTL